jgi:hypothetical protein
MISTKNFLEITNDFCDLEMINDFYEVGISMISTQK